MVRILISSHSYVVGLNQQKIEALSVIADLKISLVVPKSWKAPLRDTPLEKKTAKTYQIIPLNTRFNGNNDRYFFPFFSLFKIFWMVRPKIVHIEEEPWSVSLLEFSLLSRIFAAKTIFFTWENIERQHKFWYKLFEKINLKLASGAIVGNREAKDLLLKKGFQKPILVLPQLGVNLNSFKREKEKNEKFTIGFVGRFEEQKGVMVLLDAVKQLPFSYKLLLVGSGSLKEKIDFYIKENNLLDKVDLIQGVTHNRVLSYLNRMDLLVLPSLTTSVWKEQFGHVLIEAMASGVPVIGSDSGAIPEVIADAGLIFKEGEVALLIEKIKKIYENENLREELIKKGLARIKENYTQEKIAAETYRFYQKILI